MVIAFALLAGQPWFDACARHSKNVVKMVPDASLLSA